MSTILVVNTTVKDADKFKDYAAAAGPTLKASNAEILHKGQLQSVLHGEQSHASVAIIQFPDQATLDSWYASPAYQALIPNRNEAADMVFSSYDLVAG